VNAPIIRPPESELQYEVSGHWLDLSFLTGAVSELNAFSTVLRGDPGDIQEAVTPRDGTHPGAASIMDALEAFADEAVTDAPLASLVTLSLMRVTADGSWREPVVRNVWFSEQLGRTALPAPSTLRVDSNGIGHWEDVHGTSRQVASVPVMPEEAGRYQTRSIVPLLTRADGPGVLLHSRPADGHGDPPVYLEQRNFYMPWEGGV
jgi:hypothetical protein